MKISHIFAAIELDSLDPGRFSKHLVDAWRKVRFASPPRGYSGSDALGAALIGTDNFAWKSSGWFDKSGITFPAKLIPQSKDGLRAHLEWMIDCRRDKDTLAYLWKKGVQEFLPRHMVRACFVERKDLDELVEAILRLSRDEPLLAKALLTGRLWRASALVAKKRETLEAGDQLNTVVHMALIWALFDLQVIAYRLFHAEWNALDAGMDSAENMTVESLQKIARTIADMGKRAAKLFRTGMGLKDSDPELLRFILDNNLIKVARKNVARLNIKPATLGTRAAERQAITAYLQYLKGRLQEIERIFNRRSVRPRLTVSGYAAHAAGVSKARFAPGPIRDPKARSLGIKQSVATARFSLPALTALLYAVEGVVKEVGALPSGGKVRRDPTGQFRGGKALLQKRQRKQLIERLFTTYRDLFVRSHFNSRDGVEKDEYLELAQQAEQAIANEQPDPGLEPLTPQWQARPFKPLYPGVPARRLLALGKDDGSLEGDFQDPARWAPKRVSAERKAETDAIRSLASDASARRHFRDRAARIDKEFGSGLTHRLHPGSADTAGT